MPIPFKIRCYPDQKARWQQSAKLAGITHDRWATAALDQTAAGRLKVRFTEPIVDRGWTSHGGEALVEYYIRRTQEQLEAWKAAATKVPWFASQTGGTNVSEWCRQVLDYAATCEAEVVFRK